MNIVFILPFSIHSFLSKDFHLGLPIYEASKLPSFCGQITYEPTSNIEKIEEDGSAQSEDH